MNQRLNRRHALGTLAGTFGSMVAGSQFAWASNKSAVKMQAWKGAIDYVVDGPSAFTMQGTASHLGKFTAIGEVNLVETDVEGVLEGTGVVVFAAANGDLLVGSTTWRVNGDSDSAIHFGWRDSVEFSDGTVVTNTGRFVNDRPPGLVVIAIIAILVGLMYPAVLK